MVYTGSLVQPITMVYTGNLVQPITMVYFSPGLKRSSDRMRDRASRDLCPPDSSVSVSFHTEPNATFTSKPAMTLSPSGGCSLAVVPGSRVEKMLPKSRLTLTQVVYIDTAVVPQQTRWRDIVGKWVDRWGWVE